MAVFTLKPGSPFRLDLTVWGLRRVPVNEMDRWDGLTYRRTLVLDEAPVEVDVRQGGPLHDPELTVRTRGARLGSKRRSELIATLEKMLGLNITLEPLYRLAAEHRRLAALIEPFRGFRPPRLPSIFETILNGIACQQVSLAAGMHVLNRLCQAYGRCFGESHAFPHPADLTAAAPRQLRSLGFSTRKAGAILEIANAIVADQLDLEALSALDDVAALERLLALKGVGRWTAQYVLLRGLGRLDVFPADDVGGQNKMQRWLGRKKRPTYDQIYRTLAPWQPYRGLIYFYLLLEHQARLGLFAPGSSGTGFGTGTGQGGTASSLSK